MQHTRSAALLACAALVAACGGNTDRSDSSPPANGDERSPSAVRAKAVADRCTWSRSNGSPTSAGVRAVFVTGLGGGDADRPERLLLEANRLKPGQEIAVTVDNRSERGVLYGAAAGLEDAATGEQVPTATGAIPLIGLSAPPGAVGPCVPLTLRNTTPPGRYRVVAGRATAEILVQGEPVDAREFTTEGTRPKSPITTLYEPESPSGHVVVDPVRELGQTLFGERAVETWIDRHPAPPVVRLTVHEGTEEDADDFLKAVDASPRLSRDAVALDSTPFSRRDLAVQAKRVEEILEDEPGAGFGFGELHHFGLIEVYVPEISIEAKERFEALPGPPVKVVIEG